MNLTTFEESLKLKNWGAPQSGFTFYHNSIGSISTIEDIWMKARLGDYIAAYDLEALIDWILSRLDNKHLFSLSKDGDAYCCRYGENLQVGLAGFGLTGVEAAFNLADALWGGER